MDSSNLIDNKPLRTHKRLDDIINNYNEYIEDLERKQDGFKKVSSPSGSVVYKPEYLYYHFQVSPEGVDRKTIGNLPATELMNVLTSWKNYFNTNAGNKTLNTTNYWLMDLGKIENSLYETDQSNLKNATKNEVMINHMFLNNKVLDVFKSPEQVALNNSNQSYFIPEGEPTVDISSIFQNTRSIQDHLDNCIANRVFYQQSGSNTPNTATTTNLNEVSANYFSVSPTNNILSNVMDTKLKNIVNNVLSQSNLYVNASYVCTEMITYVKVPVSQYYNIRVTSNENIYVMAWCGDEAVSEYMYNNSILNASTTNVSYYFDASKYYFMRIQVYFYLPANFSTQTSIDLDYSITFEPTSPEQNSSPILYSYYQSSLEPYLPTLLYTSFVTTSTESYKVGKFQCYNQLDGNNKIDNGELRLLYTILTSYKYAAFNNMFNEIDNVQQYGQLPNGIYYTLGETAPQYLPSVFYLYRVNSDRRLGKSYQIDTSLNRQNQYEMKEIPEKFLKKSDTYTIYPRYYPTETEMSQALTTTNKNIIQNGGVNTCQTICNQDKNCNYFYTFSLNNNDDSQAQRCFIDSSNNKPSFNQINPYVSSTENIQPGSSNLYVREKQFSNDVKKMCATSNSDEIDIQVQNLKQTTDYGSSFPFSNYYINDNPPLTNVEDVNICANKKQINKYNNCFKEVLTGSNLYGENGDVENGGACSFLENFESEISTNAMKNTQIQGINYLAEQKGDIEKNMDSITSNYEVLSKEKIPEYIESKKALEQSGYSELQDKNLMFIGKPNLNAAQKSIQDNNDRFVNMQLMFALAMLTIFVLLVFIFMMD